MENAKRQKKRSDKEPPNFLKKSGKLLDEFRSRGTDSKLKLLRQELQSFEPGNRPGGFSFSLALMQVRKDIKDQEREKFQQRITKRTKGGNRSKEAETPTRMMSYQETKLKTLNSFLHKYSKKFDFGAGGKKNPMIASDSRS